MYETFNDRNRCGICGRLVDDSGVWNRVRHIVLYHLFHLDDFLRLWCLAIGIDVFFAFRGFWVDHDVTRLAKRMTLTWVVLGLWLAGAAVTRIATARARRRGQDEQQ